MRMDELYQQFHQFCLQSKTDGRFTPSDRDWRPVLDEDGRGMSWDQHYVYHLGWAARILARTRPAKHVDISALTYFPAIVSAFVNVDYYEFRRVNIDGLSGLACGSADVLNLPFGSDSIPSLSFMHCIEHCGLGRYGDQLDAQADIKAAAELKRVLAPGGQLLMAAPCGRPRIMFNAHRIYSYQMMMDLFNGLSLREFSLFSPRTGYFYPNADPNMVPQEEHECGACGMWWFEKRA